MYLLMTRKNWKPFLKPIWSTGKSVISKKPLQICRQIAIDFPKSAKEFSRIMGFDRIFNVEPEGNRLHFGNKINGIELYFV